MIDGLVIALWVATGALALYGLASTAANRPPDRVTRIAVGAVEALLVVQAVLAVIGIVQGFPLADPTEVVIYLVVSVCVLPIATQFANAEPSRWGGTVIAVGAIATGVAVWRLQGLWVPVA